jgi:hypothetical protein
MGAAYGAWAESRRQERALLAVVKSQAGSQGQHRIRVRCPTRTALQVGQTAHAQSGALSEPCLC